MILNLKITGIGFGTRGVCVYVYIYILFLTQLIQSPLNLEPVTSIKSLIIIKPIFSLVCFLFRLM